MKLFFKHDFLKIITAISFFIMMMTATFVTFAESNHDEHEGEKHKEQEEHEGEEDHIALTPEQLKNADIQLAKVNSATIRETLPLYGTVALNSEKVQNISARFPGVIRSISRKVGDRVSVGDTLAIIESNESLKNYTLTATSNGVITERPANAGEQTADRTLFVIADLSSVLVELAVFPRDISKVKTGQLVRIQQAQMGLTGLGKLIYLSPSANNANQTLTARVLLDNAKQEWVTGLFVSAEVTLAQTSVMVAVQNEALQTLENNTVVFVQGEEGFEPRPVRLGKADSEYTEVLEGLSVDETYVAKNSFILKSDLGKEGAKHEH